VWNADAQYTRVKLCWFEELEATFEACGIGADALGFHILRGPNTNWREKAERFRAFFEVLPARIEKVLLIDLDWETTVEALQVAPFDSVQLYPDWHPEEIERMKTAIGRPIRVIKVMSAQLHENEPSDPGAFLSRYSETVDAILLDSCREGGSGLTGDWDLCRRIVTSSPIPVFLAGGLSPSNVGDAIQAVRPFGVDVESGVSDRVAGRGLLKNLGKCRAFVSAVTLADRAILQTNARAAR